MTFDTSPPPPIIPVQIPEIYGLAQMPDFDIRAAVEVGDDTGHLQDAESTPFFLCRRASKAMGNAPRTGCSEPSNDSSPIM